MHGLLKQFIKMKKATLLFILSIFFTLSALAQGTALPEIPAKSGVLKISPSTAMAGASFKISEQAQLRPMLNFHTDFTESGSGVYFDLSYIRYSQQEWAHLYWGLNLGTLIDSNPLVIPGVLTGVYYPLNDRLAIFGELALNVAIDGERNEGLLGMFNSGVGFSVGF